MRPPGPDPRTAARSSPCSLASRRARGDASARPPVLAIAAPDVAACAAGATAEAGAAGVGGAAAAPPEAPATIAEMSSSFAAITPTRAPTGAVVPSARTCFLRTPSPRATSSMIALSVSTSASTSPCLTASPSFLTHFARRPSSIVGLRASMKTFVAMMSVGRRRAAGRSARPGGVQSRYMTLRTAATVLGTSGFAAFSSAFAYGIGTSAWCTRSTGASRWSKQSRWT